MRRQGADDLVRDYLRELQTDLRPLSRWRRRQLVDEIAQHIDQGRAELGDQEPATVAALLESVGDPGDIAAEALGESGPWSRSRPPGRAEDWAIGLLLFGGFLFAVGWFVGVYLLWSSRVWRLSDKIIGTLLVPGGLASTFILGGVAGLSTGSVSGSVCTSTGPAPAPVAPGPGDASTAHTLLTPVHTTCQALGSTSTGIFPVDLVVVVVVLVIPILTAIYLNRRRRHLVLVPAPSYR